MAAFTGQAIAIEPTITFAGEDNTNTGTYNASFPADGVGTSGAGRNFGIVFGSAIYADASGTAFTNTTIDDIITLTKDHEDGTPVGFDATISSNTVIINPTSSLNSGEAMILSVTDDWYYGSGGTKTQGSAYSSLTGYNLANTFTNEPYFGLVDYAFTAGTGFLDDNITNPNAAIPVLSD